jgi:hypothetical protein
MRVLPAETPADLAAAVASLQAPGPLPARTVLVRSERHAHALRRALVRAGHATVLAGTRFVAPLGAAIEVLHAAGVPFAPGEEGLRPVRLRVLLGGDLALEHFDRALLRTTRGWDEAFSRAIGDLEGAGLAPADLPRDPPQARDLARVWARAAADAGSSWPAARVYAEAAALLAREPRAWPFDGPALAAVTGHEQAALASFLRAIPGVALALRPARPVRPRHVARVEALFGADARAALLAAPGAAGPRPTERDLLAGFLFADPALLAAPGRPRSRGPDGTVHLEEHAGVDAELEAAASWVARKVLEDRLPLEEVAVLVPGQDPLARLVADRLARLPFEGGTLPVHVAGGIPAVATAGGARILAVLRALEAHLSADSLAGVLPTLRLPGDGARVHLSHAEATELAYGLGTVGGNAAHPAGALAWSERAARREVELALALERARREEDSGAREARHLERALASLRAVRPALDALVGVARAVVGGAPLAALREALGAFLRAWVLLPGDGAALPPRLDAALAPACEGPPGRALAGAAALEVVGERLLDLRVPRGRFGEPAVYVGTVAGAAGLDFAAVRVVGLAEGALPTAPREDPVLPEALRAALEAAVPGRALPRRDDAAAAELHALVAVVRAARRSVDLSAPRADLARTEREPAALLVEAAAALARPDAATGAPAAVVPDGYALRRDAFRPAREAAARFHAAHPVSEADWLDRAARGAPDLPPAWTRDPLLDLGRLAALLRPAGPLGPGDGVLGAGGPFPALPGLSPDRPISASALGQLLLCPRMFLMRRVLGWDEPAAAPPLRELDPAAFGTLLHRVLEDLYRAHGADLVAGKRSLAHWTGVAGEIAARRFEELLSEVPLVGEGVRRKELKRLLEAARAFVAYDWKGRAGRRFVGVELPFGEPVPLALRAGGETLHLRGYLDRVDVERDAALVRDVKSGAPHPRRGDEEGPVAAIDVQLGLYALAARALAAAWGTPRKVVAAYAYASGRGEVQERAFRGDCPALERAAEDWLATAARLLASRSFPPTPDEDDCRFCPFRPLCGGDGPRRAREGLARAAGGALAPYRSLRGLAEEEG